MPHLDAYGRWVSDDGALYWDGRAWQPMTGITGYPAYYPAPTAPPGPSSVKGPVALGLGIASLVFWLLPALGLPVAIAALVMSWLALGTSGRRLGRWGQVLGAIGLVLSLINFAAGAYMALHPAKG